MTFGCVLMRCFAVLLAFAQLSRSLEISDFYDFEKTVRLENGAEKFEYIKLDTPIHFFSDIHDHIYINTKGILTFGVEMSTFLNVPFPLEYSSIAPFYSNIDTTNAGPETSISFSTLQSDANNRRAYDIISRNFPQKRDELRIVNVFVATWENVGHYNENNTQQNTFQVAIICADQDTFVEFLYPRNGLNWLQGDLGESGLPDVRAQAGFVTEDGRFLTLTGSGTENAKYFSELSNHGQPGSWIYRIGHLGFENSIEEPDQQRYQEYENQRPKSCSNGGNLKCHISAMCRDKQDGFSCRCKQGFYGDGLNCIRNDVPLRVSGKVTGRIGDAEVNAQLQSYVVISDGRTYTSISPLSNQIGFGSQLAYHFGYGIAWMFAKPVGNDNAPNGYQITGGKLNQTITVRFESSFGNEELLIVQRFSGLNAWDQLAVDIDVNGNLPQLPAGSMITFPDSSDTYIFQSDTKIQSAGNGVITVDDQNVTFIINQLIEFENSPESEKSYDTSPIHSRVSKITAQYQERDEALRIGMINKAVTNSPVNPCTDGSASCGSNAVCIPDQENDSYRCECRNGFTLDDSESCVDIDECASNIKICDENADCYNDLGGYSCRCRSGYTGNGYNCRSRVQDEYTEEPQSSTTDSTPSIPALAPEHWLCDQCSEHADCHQGVCVCKNGWNGDGIECVYNCPDEYVWNIDRCEVINSNSEEEDEVVPFCHKQGCSCPTGYEFAEVDGIKTCRLAERFEEEEEKLPCDVENNCHHFANCEWVESELRNRCICNSGYEGNGFECVEHEVSCLIENICDTHATCLYDELVGKSVCKCDKKYIGDGKSCQLAPECTADEECSENSHCFEGVCMCNEGFERDTSDFCVPSGFCGGTYCTTNAVCLWDEILRVSYCSCSDGFVGDGLRSCKEIPPKCNVRNNCGLNAQCLPSNDTYECVCNSGYYGDGLTCVPERNCVNIPELCHEFASCLSTKAGYQCVCKTGYVGNGSFCQEPVKEATGFLLLSQGVATVKIPFDGKRGYPIAMSSMAIGVDNDCSTGRVYWSDITTKQIYSSKYDGTDKKIFISENISSPEGIAIDWVSRRIYWTDSDKDTIEVAALDDSSIRATIIKTGLVNPRGIAVDPHQSKLYWSDWNRENPRIEFSNLDGSDRDVLLASPALNLPNSLTISARTGELCFADAGTQKIECIEPYRRSVRTVASNLLYPFGLTSTEDRFYWTDWTTKKIESADEHGIRYPSISSPLFGNQKMYGITAVTDECPLFFSECQINNGDCPSNSICLLNRNLPYGRHCQSA